jgi:hypothetical protein
MMQEEQPLQVCILLDVMPSNKVFYLSNLRSIDWFVNQVARCTKIINPNTEDAKYVINVKQIAKVTFILNVSFT